MLLDYLQGIMNRFWVVNDIRAISSSDSVTLYNRGEATISEVVSTIFATSEGVVSPHETGIRNGGMQLLSTEETGSLWVVPIPSCPVHGRMGWGHSGFHIPLWLSTKGYKKPFPCHQQEG